MTDLERSIRRDLGRAGVPVHLRRRMAQRAAATARANASGAALSELTDADVRRRAAMLDGDVGAAKAARNGAAAGEALALTFLSLGRHVSAGLDRMQAHFRDAEQRRDAERRAGLVERPLSWWAARAEAEAEEPCTVLAGVPVHPGFAARNEQGPGIAAEAPSGA